MIAPADLARATAHLFLQTKPSARSSDSADNNLTIIFVEPYDTAYLRQVEFDEGIFAFCPLPDLRQSQQVRDAWAAPIPIGIMTMSKRKRQLSLDGFETQIDSNVTVEAASAAQKPTEQSNPPTEGGESLKGQTV